MDKRRNCSVKKARVLKWRSKHNLPDEIWNEILLRLPVKSLLRFRSVSRSWKIWIDDPKFTRLHLNCFNNRPNSPILFVQGGQSECVVKNIETFRTISSLGFLRSELESVHLLRTIPDPKGVALRSWHILSSLDGLCLLQSGELDQPDQNFMLWNPSIRKTLPLPPFPAEIPGYLYPGLGFDSLNKEYKVVGFGSQPSGVPLAAVYTLGTNSWKIIDISLASHSWKSSIYFDGVLYGVAREYGSYKRKLVSFQLSTEIFASYELPVINGRRSTCSLTTVDDGCSLALVHLSNFEGCVWVLERLGDDTDAVSWIQRYAFPSYSAHWTRDCDFLYMKKNDEMLMKCCRLVLCCNLEIRTPKILMARTKEALKMAKVVTYMESLILHS